jgi:hypothetical protein
MLVGHSRGAKVNSLAAAWFPQDVRGIVNIDPVDSLPPFHRLSPDYPSALPLVRGLSTPTLNVGSQLGNQSALFGKACAPQGKNKKLWKLECSAHTPFPDAHLAKQYTHHSSLTTSQWGDASVVHQETSFCNALNYRSKNQVKTLRHFLMRPTGVGCSRFSVRVICSSWGKTARSLV